MELEGNLTHVFTYDRQPCWHYLAMIALPLATLITNTLFIMAVRHSRCFSSPTSQYMVSLSAGQILLALLNQIPTIIVYVMGVTNSSGCFFLTTLDIFAVTIPPVHFLAILSHRLSETKYFTFLTYCRLKLPSFILPWLFSILVAIAAITDFSFVGFARNEIGVNKNCLLAVSECWIWVVPLTLDGIVFILSTILWCITRRTRNTTNGISIVNRCSGDWTKSMALVFIDPNDLINPDDGDSYVVTDNLDNASDDHIEYTGLTATNIHAEICDAILEGNGSDSSSQKLKHDTKSNLEEEILEPDTNALLLNDAIITGHITHRSQTSRSLSHAVRTACLAEVTTIIQAVFVFFQLPYVIIYVVLCTMEVEVGVLLLRILKWVGLSPGIVVPVLHMTLMPTMYKNLIVDKLHRFVLSVGWFNRYHRA